MPRAHFAGITCFNQKLFANLSLIFSDYKFQISAVERSTQDTETYSLHYNSGIRDFSLKYDFDYYPTPQHSVRVGIQSTYHRFTPSAVVLQNAGINQSINNVENIDVLESGIYAEDTWRPSSRWRVNGGLRLSYFQQKDAGYIRPEPRISAAYTLKPDLSVKGVVRHDEPVRSPAVKHGHWPSHRFVGSHHRPG